MDGNNVFFRRKFLKNTVISGGYMVYNYEKHMEKTAQALGSYAVSYLAFHEKRFVHLLEKLLPKSAIANNGSILELGAFFPFTSCLKTLGYHTIKAADMPVWCSKDSFTITIEMIEGNLLTFEVPVFNVEKDIFPYEDTSVETVLCLELIEHLPFDPMHCLSEINRILIAGGKIVISTPNICALSNVERILCGKNPIGNQIYDPNNLYARHNAEMTRYQLADFLEYAGFEIELIDSFDFLPSNNHLSCDAREYFSSLCIDKEFRGDTLYCIAKKISHVKERRPKPVYV